MNRFVAFLLLMTTAACATDDDDMDEGGQAADSEGGADDSEGAADDSEGGTESECDSAITECALGDLSSAQFADYCDLVLASIAAAPGDRFDCAESGLFLDVSTREQCVSVVPPGTCSVTVGESIACYKAAEGDACAAFDDECAFVSDPSTGCWG